jgi:RNA polymerase sigma-70 factor (ECF subfamily)
LASTLSASLLLTTESIRKTGWYYLIGGWRAGRCPKAWLDLVTSLTLSSVTLGSASTACKRYNEKLFTPHHTGCGRNKGDLTDAKKLQGGKLSEAAAIERAKQGDAEAFETLYHLHKRRVYSLCLRMTANTAAAEDLTQEAFLQLFRKIGTFRGESAFSTWLHRMAVNVVLMQLRKKSLAVVPLEDTLESEEESPRREPGADDVRLSGAVDRLQLQRAVADLPPGYRKVFLLHDVEGYEHNEIASLVGCSIGNSKSQLHKARMKLRDLLKMSRAEKATKP